MRRKKHTARGAAGNAGKGGPKFKGKIAPKKAVSKDEGPAPKKGIDLGLGSMAKALAERDKHMPAMMRNKGAAAKKRKGHKKGGRK